MERRLNDERPAGRPGAVTTSAGQADVANTNGDNGAGAKARQAALGPPMSAALDRVLVALEERDLLGSPAAAS